MVVWSQEFGQGRSFKSIIAGESRLSIFPWVHEDWKQALVMLAYAAIGIAGIVYVLPDAGGPADLLSRLGDVGSVLFLFVLVTEGAVWIVVIALGEIINARNKGREEGRAEEYAAMIKALRDAGISEHDIRRVKARREARGNRPARA